MIDYGWGCPSAGDYEDGSGFGCGTAVGDGNLNGDCQALQKKISEWNIFINLKRVPPLITEMKKVLK